jgi:hypothetical protein
MGDCRPCPAPPGPRLALGQSLAVAALLALAAKAAPSDHRLIDPMIRRSDNAAATRVLAYVGAARVGQRWGVARVRPDGWRLYFKGGWGSGIGLVDHQVALLRAGAYRVAVAVLTTGNPTTPTASRPSAASSRGCCAAWPRRRS